MMNQKTTLNVPDFCEALPKQDPASPCIMVIFGISGDLTKRLLLPALCNLGRSGLLDEKFSIVGIARAEQTDDVFRDQMRKDIDQFVADPVAKEYGHTLLNRMYYIAGDVADPNIYNSLKNRLKELETETGIKNYLFYFAIPPEVIATISSQLSKAQLLDEKNSHSFRRIIIEKPFGHDLESAKKLNQLLASVASEDQIFRIDHFLGKETVQNLLAFRFSNSIFEPIWNHHYIDHVQITAAESLGVELRGSYYDQTGALRDMVPNHLFQMLCLIAMEQPVSFLAEYLRDEKIKLLRSMPDLTPEDVLHRAVRGQYGAGKIGDTEVPAYRSEPNVDPNSNTETYVALKLFVDNWRWLHVPFYLRTGKRLKTKSSEILIQFKSAPPTLFKGYGQQIKPNVLLINVQPNEGISLRFGAKIPGPNLQLGQVDMNFQYSDYFGIKCQTGYETPLYDCMNGNQTFFEGGELEEIGWELVQPILDVWAALPARNFPNYTSGSWGPKEADELLERDGRHWNL